MKLLTGLFHFAQKKVQVKDAESETFRTKILELVEKKDSLSDEEIAKQVESLKSMVASLPDTEEKEKLNRFLEDFKSVKGQEISTAKEAASIVADLYEKQDKEVDKDIQTEKPKGNQEATSDTEGEQKKDNPADNDTEKETISENKEQKDSDETKEAILEEIYQYIKGRAEKDSNEKEGTSDHAPHIPVTINNSDNENSLDELYNRIKNGGR